MTVKRSTIIGFKRFVVAAIFLAAVTAVSTYGTWGYQPQLAVESVPVAGAEINPEFQFSIEYRKRFDALPGAKIKLVAVDRDDIAEIRGTAITAYDWSMPDLRGTTYCFVPDYKPRLGWTERDPMAEPVSAELN